MTTTPPWPATISSRRSLATRSFAAKPFRKTFGAVAGIGAVLAVTSCASDEEFDTLTLDFATYNPLSLVILENGWLEEELEPLGVDVEWVQSQGSNIANQNLRAGNIDIGSTAGSAALLNRAVGADTETILIESQPEWSALVTEPEAGISEPEDLAGASVAVTLGTDPYFFLMQMLAESDLSTSDITIEALQHSDGFQALRNGDVDAWMGLDPIMASAEFEGAELAYRNVDFNSYSVLSANTSFLDEQPEVAQIVVNVYEQARQWAQQNPEGVSEILAERAGIDLEVAEQVIQERVNFDVDPVPGDQLYDVLETVGPFFVENGDLDSQDDVDAALDTLFNPAFAANREATEATGSADAAQDADISETEEQ